MTDQQTPIDPTEIGLNLGPIPMDLRASVEHLSPRQRELYENLLKVTADRLRTTVEAEQNNMLDQRMFKRIAESLRVVLRDVYWGTHIGGPSATVASTAWEIRRASFGTNSDNNTAIVGCVLADLRYNVLVVYGMVDGTLMMDLVSRHLFAERETLYGQLGRMSGLPPAAK